eukprot:CAMPEP_0194200888 /NCGR_PEP_ID=MMETSP0156-20130528/1318_1 /TAXON_ID=33649 /ORGANISM="Thalassionema nitzschioides, Strain L26-B" /LENGTH=407 /DNA_ID=CAMNT_0038925957 /DNA_START=410 /DNA_END=1633 /DNA_ORIENTATION=+
MTPTAPQQPPSRVTGTSQVPNPTSFPKDLKATSNGSDGSSSSAWGKQLNPFKPDYSQPLKPSPTIFESRVSSSAWVEPLKKECPVPEKANPSIFEDAEEEPFKRVISQAMKPPSSNFESRVSSSSWVGALKREISQPENPTPSIFEDAEEDEIRIPSVDSNLFRKFTSGDSTTSGLELLAVATMQSNEESARTLSNGSMVNLGAVSFGANSAQSTSGNFPLAVANKRATTVEYLKKMGILDSATKSTNSLIQERLGVSSNEDPAVLMKAESPPPKTTKSVGSQPLKKRINSMALEAEHVPDASAKEWDIISGRGGKSNHHPGNKRFRQVVDEMKNKYRTTNVKTDKTALSKAIVDYVESYGGRFLTKKNAKGGHYRVMTKAESRKKTSQALRETKELKWKLNGPPTP